MPERFADELARCINRTDLRANFLIAIREDAYAALGDLFKGRIPNVYGNYLHIDSLDRACAERAIREPLAVYNSLHDPSQQVTLQNELVEAVLDDICAFGVHPDGPPAAANGHSDVRIATPLLQLVMERVWNAERDEGSHRLRLATLQKLRGVKMIVDEHLGKALDSLGHAERHTAIDMFGHLVTPSGGKIAESVSDLAERTGHSEEQVSTVLDKLDHERIVRPIPAAPGQDPIRSRRYEIFHDVLAPTINRAIAAREEQRRVRRIRRFAALAVAVMVIVAAVAVSFAYLWLRADSEKLAADNQSHVAQSQDMAAEAMNLLPADGPLAMLLSLQAYERAHTPQAESALIQAAQQPLDDLLVPGSTVRSVAFSPDGRTLATGEASGHVGLWDLATGHQTATLTEGSFIYSVAFSPDGRTLAVGDHSGRVGLWDVATRQKIATLAEGSPVDSCRVQPGRADPGRRRLRRLRRLVGRGDRAEDRHPARRQHGR